MNSFLSADQYLWLAVTVVGSRWPLILRLIRLPSDSCMNLPVTKFPGPELIGGQGGEDEEGGC